MRNHPRFASLWQRDPGLSELAARRGRALAARQTAGFTGDDRRVTTLIPAAVIARVRAALARR